MSRAQPSLFNFFGAGAAKKKSPFAATEPAKPSEGDKSTPSSIPTKTQKPAAKPAEDADVDFTNSKKVSGKKSRVIVDSDSEDEEKIGWQSRSQVFQTTTVTDKRTTATTQWMTPTPRKADNKRSFSGISGGRILGKERSPLSPKSLFYTPKTTPPTGTTNVFAEFSFDSSDSDDGDFQLDDDFSDEEDLLLPSKSKSKSSKSPKKAAKKKKAVIDDSDTDDEDLVISSRKEATKAPKAPDGKPANAFTMMMGAKSPTAPTKKRAAQKTTKATTERLTPGGSKNCNADPPSSEEITATREFLHKKKSVEILPNFPALEPTLADLCQLSNVNDETIKKILTTELKQPSDSKRHIFNVTSVSWMVAFRPLLVKEKVTVFDKEGKRHSRVADVEVDGKDKVSVKFEDRDTAVVSRTSIWPDVRKKININSLSKQGKATLMKAALAFPPPQKSRIENLISSAGTCDLERDVLVLLKKMVETINFPGFLTVKLHISDDGLLVDALLELVKEGESDPRFVYIQAKTDSSAFNSLQRKTSFNKMTGYGEKIVILSICTKTLFGAITGKELNKSDPWYTLPMKEEKKDVVSVPLSTFMHFDGSNVTASQMSLTYSPPGTPDKEGTVIFLNEPHNINAAFSDPMAALQWIIKEATSNASRFPVHSCRRFADFTFALDADDNRKEACALHVFKAELTLTDKEFRLPEAQNSLVDAEIHSTAFLRVHKLAKLLRASKESGKFADIMQRIKRGEDFYVRVQFKTLIAREAEKTWLCPGFGKSIGGTGGGGGKKGRYSQDDFDLSFFASFDYVEETIDFRALWTSELIENNPDVFDSSKKSSAGIYFQSAGKVWSWTLALEKDAIRGCSVRFAKKTDSDLDTWMMVLFEGSKKAGIKREREE
ncbi:hypothetical protein TrVE_jg8398 [Triparma verrucosa]|uniref:Uncharacterized protein n=1 Tax=Triparma verrucosa TaxID=1606542 RepID=A0A9W7F7R9_9STRA|nr:hypothetical protein TrVE_jg8398 [Triparma verrucosa]